VRFCGFLAIAAICLAAPLATPQAHKSSAKDLPPSAFKLISVKVTGTNRYKPEEIVSAAGLQMGQTVHDDDLKNVVRLLGESGAFAAVSYSSQFDPEGTKVELRLQDAQKFFPVRFENMVWFSDQELSDKLHASVPLFNGQLPLNGELAGELSDALQALLVQKKVAGQVDYVRPEDTDSPSAEFVYTVSGPSITIRNVEFSGAGADELPMLTAAAKGLEGAAYVRPAIREMEDKALLPIFHEHGYLKAVIGDPKPTVVQNDPNETLVDVTLPVDPGHQYKLRDIQVAGNKTLEAAAIRAVVKAKPGEIANTVELDKDLEAIRHLYGAHGYMGAVVKGQTELDDAGQFTALYSVNIVEGDIYKMGEVEIRGLDSKMTAKLQNNWTMHSGDTYDSSYVGRFLEQAYKQIGDWHVSVNESVDDHDKTVDVTVRFDPNS
jgi:outer membrane protein assembly factor BamA